MFSKGTPVKYRRRNFTVVGPVPGTTLVVIVDDEGERLTVPGSSLS